MRTSRRCLEILFGVLVVSPPVLASPDEVTLESKASLFPTTTLFVWLEPLLDEDPFVTDDVVTVMEGATRDPVLEEVADNPSSAEADAMPNQLMNVSLLPIDNF